jgi:signal transduction histidine kinase
LSDREEALLGTSLSGRLLLLTVVTVMVMEALILVPSVARFRVDWLEERLRSAQLASLAILATPEGMLDGALEDELLERAGAASIVLRRGGARALVLSAVIPKPIDATYDLRDASSIALLIDGLRTVFAPGERHIRVIGRPDGGGADADEVEITMDEAPMREALVDYGRRILFISLAISATTAALIYLLVQRLLVAPIERIVENMTEFREDPEDLTRVMRPASKVREIAAAETALADMQTQVREALRERSRLAALGEAVAKISHDLRNILASAQLAADRIEHSRDPFVRTIGPKLIGAIDRAIRLCEGTLNYGRAEEAPPEPRRIALAALVGEVAEAVFPDPQDGGPVAFENRTPSDLVIEADPEQLFRVMTNLVRNARQAIESAARPGAVTVTARKSERSVEIDVEDDGPGLPTKALDHLFKPFKGAARKGGTGLGLAIAHELVKLQGGRLDLVRSTTQGTQFRITLPV